RDLRDFHASPVHQEDGVARVARQVDHLAPADLLHLDLFGELRNRVPGELTEKWHLLEVPEDAFVLLHAKTVAWLASEHNIVNTPTASGRNVRILRRILT